MRLFRALAIASLLIFPAAPRVMAEFWSELEPTYSECYEDLKLLSTRGLVPAGLADTRPLTRGQIAALLAEGLRADREALMADPLGLRMVRLYSAELRSMGIDVPFQRHAPFWRRQTTSVAGGASGPSGGPRDFPGGRAEVSREPGRDAGGGSGRSAGGQSVRLEIIPYAWVRVDNVEPIYFRKLADRRIGFRGTVSTAGGMLVVHDDIVAGTHSAEPRGIPNFGTLNALVEGEDFNTWIHRGYIRLNTKILDLVFARDWIRWGPGRTGTLGMGDSAPALNHLLLRRRTEKFDFTTFVATLDYGDEEMLAGHRLEARISDDLVLGIAEQVRFRTLQQVPVYLFAFYPYSIVEKVMNVDTSGPADWRNNVMLSFDADWIPAPRTRLYGEFLLDDWSFSSDRKPAQLAYQLGVVRSGLGAMNELALAAEVTKVHRYTYSQARRTDEDGAGSLGRLDFAHNGYSLGHPLGPDSEGYYVAATYDASASSRWDLSVEVRRHGELDLGEGWNTGEPVPATFPLSGTVETSTRVMLAYTFYPERWAGSWVTIGGGLRRVTNAGNLDGESTGWDGIMKASLMASW